MAEVVGVVVGVVSLGVQLAESLQKVKRFYDTMRGAPERLADIIDEIGSLSDILTELEQHPTSSGPNTGPTMQRCVAACRKAVDRFSTYANSLESRMKRSKRLGSVKFAMKNESVESVIASLESSKSNLVLAYMMYREAVADKRARHMQEQMNLFASGQASLLQQRETLQDGQLTMDKRPERRSHRLNYVRSKPMLKTPIWLNRTVWEMAMDRAISGWTFSIRSYSLVDYESGIVDAICSGDTALLQQSFDMRKASPFDEIVFGSNYDSPRFSLLQLAVVSRQMETARFLVRYGTRSLEPWAMMSSICLHLSETPTRESIDAEREWCRFLFENSDLNDIDEETLRPGDAADLANTRAFMYGDIKESTATLFWTILISFYRPDLDNFEILAINDDTSYLLNYGSFDDRTKFKCLALAYARSATSASECSASNMRMLGELVIGAIDIGYDLHDSTDGISPLLRILHGGEALSMEARLHAWLTLLKSTGVNLHMYGQEEWNRFQALRRGCEGPWDWWHGVDTHQCGSFLDSEHGPTLIAFAYGEDVSDWKLWLLHPGDHHAGEFWMLIEQNGIYCRHVPGGWVEDGWL